MNGFSFVGAPHYFIEFGQNSLAALNGERGLELPLQRSSNGRLTEVCMEKLVLSLQAFFKHSPWQPRPRVLCAIGARGVSLRRLALPPATGDNLHRLLLLQIESAFPLPPDELAWGYRPLTGLEHTGAAAGASPGRPSGKQEFLVAAVKKEAVEEYAELLAKCGVTPLFTLAALARTALCPHGPGSGALLDVGRNYSEFIAFENGVPLSLRVVSWGGEDVTRSMEERLRLDRNDAEELKLSLAAAADARTNPDPRIEQALDAALDSLAEGLNGQRLGRKLYLTGRTARNKELAAGLTKRLGVSVEPVPAGVEEGEGRSAAVLGLRRASENGAAPLVMQVKPTNGAAAISQPAPWKWVGLAASLLLALLVLPYLEALLLKPHLAKKLAALRADRGRLGAIDRELTFLQYLRSNQPPCLDTLFVMAKAAPQGARFDSLSMSRRGELSWRGTMKDSQQVTDFRSKLIDSGLFAAVSVDEQTPSSDRQKLTVRMSAQLKPFLSRQALALGPTAEEIEKAKNAPKELTAGGGGMPMGMGGGPPAGMFAPASSRKSAKRGPSPENGPARPPPGSP